MSRATPRLLVAGVLVAGAAACTDGLGDGQGTYVLRTVGDSTVPFVMSVGGGEQIVFLGDTIALDGRGNAVETSVERVDLAGTAPIIVPTTTNRRYVVRGNAVFVQFVCPPNALCAAAGPEKLAFVSGGLATTTGPFGLGTAFFERVR